MQDNDSKRTAWQTWVWVLYNTPKHIPTPPQSPDINLIEYLLDKSEKNIRN